MASVFFAVFFSILMRGFNLGVWLNLIDGVLHSYTGYVQVHDKGYWDNKTFDYSMAADNPTFLKIKSIPQVKGLIPRLESFSLASTGEKTKGVITVGVNPLLEKEFTGLDKRIVAGRYFSLIDTGVILSERLSKYLNLKTNDSIVLLSQGYQGMGANGIYRIIGIVKLPAPEYDNQMVFMPLPVAQDYYSAPGRITSMVVDLNNPQDMDKIVSKINKVIGPNHFEVMSWKEMLVELYQIYISKQGSSMILILLLYLIVGFGVFGTVLMMIAERQHEFGIMMTVGMKRHRLVSMVSMELIFICLLGLFFGFLFSLPIVAYFHFHPISMSASMANTYSTFGLEPILPTAWQFDYIIQQVYIVFAIIIIVFLFPLYSLYKLDITKAMRR